MAAISEKRSTHYEMSVTGSLAGGGARPGGWGRTTSAITSDILRNSKSRIFLTTLCGRDAIGLKGPGEWSCAATVLSSVGAALLGSGAGED